MTQSIWFPSAESANSRIVGRFVDLDDDWTDANGEKRTRRVTMLEHKVPGSTDVATSIVKPFNRAELIARFPNAWSHYEAIRGTVPVVETPTATLHGIKGTPIEDADFIGHDKMAFFKSMGFLVVEQLRDMSDSVCQNISGAKLLRKKAGEFLASKTANAA